MTRTLTCTTALLALLAAPALAQETFPATLAGHAVLPALSLVAPPADAPQDWFKALPDTLQQDKSLANFASKPIEELANGYVETKKLASSKVTLPKDDDPESFSRFSSNARS